MTGGTLARAAAEGHRVVIVVAADTTGPDNTTADGAGAPRTRLDELRDSAAVLGAHRVEHLGCADSGHGLLLGYDANGGYGHRDHVKVHVVGRRVDRDPPAGGDDAP